MSSQELQLSSTFNLSFSSDHPLLAMLKSMFLRCSVQWLYAGQSSRLGSIPNYFSAPVSSQMNAHSKPVLANFIGH